MNRTDSPPKADSSVSSISDNLQSVKNSSLLYQLISRLLLSPDQDKQLAESLEQAKATDAVESTEVQTISASSTDIQLSANSEQFNMRIEVSMFRIEQQTLTIVDESGTFTQQTTVIEAFNMSIEISMGGETEESDPLIFDVDGDGFTTTGIEHGALFDINADGILDQVSVAQSDDAFLALDLNNNGLIDNGAELFGDQTGFKNGFAYLSSFDDNQDGLIDANDKIFNSLLMMRLQDNEQFITELSKTSVESINLAYRETAERTDAGDRIVQISDYKNTEGHSAAMADLMLQYRSGFKQE